jgi:hypothetical protein
MTVALVGVGGTAFAVWTAAGAGSTNAAATTALPLTASSATVSSGLLYPGATGDATVVITNPNPFPVTVTSISGGTVTSDKGASCNASTGVTLSTQTGAFPVPANGTQTFTLAGAVSMSNASDNSCQGAVFTIPVTLTGASG